MPKLKIMPSILAADLGRLGPEIRRCQDAGADGVHIDVMDGHFVPNLSYSPETVALARRTVDLELNVHLMIENPDHRGQAFLDAGADTLLIHIEIHRDVPATLRMIRDHGARPGIVLNPDTEITAILPVIDQVDEVLFMTVYPGFGGQRFIDRVLKKVADLRAQFPELDIALDGGVNRESLPPSWEAGANIFHMGTALFGQDDMAAEIADIRKELLG